MTNKTNSGLSRVDAAALLRTITSAVPVEKKPEVVTPSPFSKKNSLVRTWQGKPTRKTRSTTGDAPLQKEPSAHTESEFLKRDWRQGPKIMSEAARKFEKIRSKQDPHKIEGVIGNAFKALGISDDIARYSFVIHWTEIVGKEIAQRTTPECLRGGALIIRVESSAWAQELSFRKEVILSRLQKYLQKGDVVNDVMFYVA